MLKRIFPLSLALSLFVFANLITHAQTEHLPDLIRRVKPSVVSVITYDAKGEVSVTGSGFFIRPGEVVTNVHVIEEAHRAEIRTLDGKGRTYQVNGIVGLDDEADLAVLSVNAPTDRDRAIQISDSLPEEGEDIFVIGSPLRLDGSISNGIVSAVREVPNLGQVIQITAPISHGNSGSPLFNMKGEVIGIITMKVTNGQNINLALSAARLKQLHEGKLLSFDELSSKNRKSPQSEALAEWWYRNGLNSLWLGNYDTALGYFENAVNRNPNRAEAWIQVGYCKVKQGKNDDAIRAFQRALQLNPDSAEAYDKLGDAYYYASRFNEAIEAYKQAARLRPDMAEAYYDLGMTYLETGDRASAIVQLHTLQPLDEKLYKKLLSEIQR
jgi:tetratricopeptide (TPR) repeat protein